MTDAVSTEPRKVRSCQECGKEDDHPRHAVQDAENGLIVERLRHMDCCAAAGCPDGSCDRILAGAGDARGASLVSYLTGGHSA